MRRDVSAHILFSASAIAGGLTKLSFFRCLERNINYLKSYSHNEHFLG